MRLALDHHYSPKIAQRLREKGHDVVAAIERGWDHSDDDSLLALCGADKRALLTNNVGDFAPIAAQWAAEGRTHSGVVLASETKISTRRHNIGAYVRALDRLMKSLPADDALVDQIRWL